MSDTAETLLVRRQGKEVVFLNDLRHRRNTALRLALPVDNRMLPAARAARGDRHDFTGVDYRGHEVIAAARPVPGTAWAVVSKIDTGEALANTRQHAWLLFVALASVVALAATAGGLTVFSMQSRFYRRQYRAAAEREAMLQRHAAEQDASDARLRESEERLRLALSGTATALYIQDADLRYVWIYNPVHHTREEMIGRTDEELFGEHGRTLTALKQRVMKSRVPARQETPLDISGTERFFDLTIEPLLAGNTVVGVRGVAVDVTDRRQLEDQLRQAQKLEAVGQLAGGVAHDFNNLLTAINGYTELVLSELPKDDPHRSDLVEVHKAGGRAAALTRQLLAFSRKQVLQPEAVEINALIMQTSTMLRRIIGEDVQLQLALGPAASVFADPGQIEQILLNLCVNARDAMPGGGRITIQTTRVSAKGGARVRIRISDTGTGIAHDVLPHIFEPFFTTKDRDRGTGLGLATVYGVVQQSGGTIDVKTEVGQGTTFELEFPEWRGAPASAALAQVASHGTESILIVEDDHPVRALAEQILVRAGYRVVSVASGAGGIDLAARERFDLLLTDMVMPDMDGHAVAKGLRAVSPDTRVLYMSGYAADVLANRGVDGSLRLLQKPFSALTLTNAVRDALTAPPAGV
jgi:PAS domain S-box-containing protein